MKAKSAVQIAAAMLLLTLNLQFSTCFAQGALTPPGAPAPTMKSLDQIQPRTPINTLPGDSQDLYVITNSGSYYLTTNITATSFFNAILIKASGVTLDLNGFTISSTGANGTAILLFGNEATGIGNSDITISNGHITGGVTNKSGVYEGPGFANGIFYNNTAGTPYNIRVTGVSVSGCANNGIYLDTDNSTVVESCTVNTVGGIGIVASGVSHSTANQCGNTAIYADTASDCYGSSTGGEGLGVNFTASDCYGSSTGGYGLEVNSANNCFGSSDSNVGLSAVNANNCFGSSDSNVGLSVNNANNCEGNSTSGVALFAQTSANNCWGSSAFSDGLSAGIATGCSGTSESSGTGLSASEIAIGCYGASDGAGLSANIANSCYSNSGDGSIVNKYNMP